MERMCIMNPLNIVTNWKLYQSFCNPQNFFTEKINSIYPRIINNNLVNSQFKKNQHFYCEMAF